MNSIENPNFDPAREVSKAAEAKVHLPQGVEKLLTFWENIYPRLELLVDLNAEPGSFTRDYLRARGREVGKENLLDGTLLSLIHSAIDTFGRYGGLRYEPTSDAMSEWNLSVEGNKLQYQRGEETIVIDYTTRKKQVMGWDDPIGAASRESIVRNPAPLRSVRFMHTVPSLDQGEPDTEKTMTILEHPTKQTFKKYLHPYDVIAFNSHLGPQGRTLVMHATEEIYRPGFANLSSLANMSLAIKDGSPQGK